MRDRDRYERQSQTDRLGDRDRVREKEKTENMKHQGSRLSKSYCLDT